MNLFKKISKIIFSRTSIAIFILFVQLFLFYVGYTVFQEYVMYFYGGYTLLSLVTVIFILNNKQNPAFKMAWMIPVLALPVFGTFMYIWARLQLIPKKLNRKIMQLKMEIAPYLEDNSWQVEKKEESFLNIAHYMYYQNLFPVYRNTEVQYFSSGEAVFSDILEELKKAQKFIFLEFFIIEQGYMWNSVLEILKQKIMEGVEVRVLYDGTCSISVLPRNYTETLQEMGIQAKEYSPLKAFISTYHNNRDHRKIIVIDGKVSYTGGVNLADEYINQRVRFGYWKDAAIKISGEAVQRFTFMFLEMWNIRAIKKEKFDQYLVSHSVKEQGYIIPYGENPFDQETISKNLFLDSIHQAKHSIYMMTPYLILDNELVTALTLAAKKNIEVVIIMPHIPDKMYAYLLARTYYEELIEAGVKIYEFTPGFVHSKIFVSDSNKAIVGSCNLDYRSLYLNFECGCYLYKHPCISDIEKDIQDTLKSCQLITLQDCHTLKLSYKIIGKILKFFAPLM